MRRIFSTVFGPHEPALTVGSLAISATGRPSIVPTPGHDAVGAEPVLLPVGEQRLLGEGALVEQQRDALAHRQLALLERLLAVALGAAGERALGARSARARSAGASAARAHRGSSRGGGGGAARPAGVAARLQPRFDARRGPAPGRAGARRRAPPAAASTTITQTGQKLPLAPAGEPRSPTQSSETPSAPPASCTRRRRSCARRLASSRASSRGRAAPAGRPAARRARRAWTRRRRASRRSSNSSEVSRPATMCSRSSVGELLAIGVGDAQARGVAHARRSALLRTPGSAAAPRRSSRRSPSPTCARTSRR